MRGRHRTLAWLALLTLLGCSRLVDTTGEKCQSDSDCATDEKICKKGRCVPGGGDTDTDADTDVDTDTDIEIGGECSDDGSCSSGDCNTAPDGKRYCTDAAKECADVSGLGDGLDVGEATCFNGDRHVCTAEDTFAAPEDCAVECGAYLNVDTCSNGVCATCPSTCNEHGECKSGAFCSNDGICQHDLNAGVDCSIAREPDDFACLGGYCRDDGFDGAGEFCAETATSCVHDGQSYADGHVMCSGNDWFRSCDSGVWSDQNDCAGASYCDAGGGAESGYKPVETCTSGATGGCDPTDCQPCEPYQADSNTSCKTTCTDVSDCWSGYICDDGACVRLIATQITTGWEHTCARTDSGVVYCWGINYDGRLGDGTTLDRATPAKVIGLGPGVVSVAAGNYHTCAITNMAGAKCWGTNYDGQLGDGTNEARATPVDVYGLSSGVIALTGGYSSTCALLSSGGVKCWGKNSSGELGNNSTEDSTTPVDVWNLGSGVQSIESGSNRVCAVMDSSGGLKCWGNNGSGQLGLGYNSDVESVPKDVPGLTSGVKSVSMGHSHTCAATTAGGVKCWGGNNYGEGGDGTVGEPRNTPQNVSGLNTGVDTISVGYGFSCALMDSGGIKCWGKNDFGQLGDDSVENRLVPVNVSGFASGANAISAGGYHNCVLTDTGGIKCSGWNAYGQLGDGTIPYETVPVDVPGLTSGVLDISVGAYHTCAVMGSGAAKCWGRNEHGELGDDTTRSRGMPVGVIGLSSGVSEIFTGKHHTCAIMASGGMRCWGRGNDGLLGYGSNQSSSTPVDVSGLESGVRSASAGDYHTCVVTDSDGIECWGNNGYGKLGDGTTENRNTPVDVVGLSTDVDMVSAGSNYTCALMNSGGVKCWGANGAGNLGTGDTDNSLEPVDVFGLTSGGEVIFAGIGTTCAVSSGGLKCWGRNEYGQLGDGTTQERHTPCDVPDLTSDVFGGAAGEGQTCAITTSGGLKCWGHNSYGRLGDGTRQDRSTPVDVVGLSSGVRKVSTRRFHTCALTDSGGVKCWGWNNYGQLGTGTIPRSLIPDDVVGFGP